MVFSATWIALQSALIPNTKSQLAESMVLLPGMMTGQVLTGISSFVAARCQIMVMFMIYGASCISCTCFLWLSRAGSIKNQ